MPKVRMYIFTQAPDFSIAEVQVYTSVLSHIYEWVTSHKNARVLSHIYGWVIFHTGTRLQHSWGAIVRALGGYWSWSRRDWYTSIHLRCASFVYSFVWARLQMCIGLFCRFILLFCGFVERAQTNEAQRRYERVMSRKWMSHVAHVWMGH